MPAFIVTYAGLCFTIFLQRLFRTSADAVNLIVRTTVYFPGIGYHCDKPLLYYSRDIARRQGYQGDRNISYTYHAGNIRGNEEKMQEAYEALFAPEHAVAFIGTADCHSEAEGGNQGA